MSDDESEAAPDAPAPVAETDTEFRQAETDATESQFEQMLVERTTAPERTTDYVFPYNGLDLNEDQLVADSQFRQILHDAQMPAEVGSYVAEAANAYALKTADHSPAQRELARLETTAMLERIWGENAPAMFAGARELVLALDRQHNGLASEILAETGAGNSPEVVMAIAQHAQRLRLAKKG